MEDIALAALPRDVESDAASDAESSDSSDQAIQSVRSDSEDWVISCQAGCIDIFKNEEEFRTHQWETHAATLFDVAISPYKVRRTDLERVIAGLEYVFSTENLRKDLSFRKKMDSEGFVPLSDVAIHERIGGKLADATELVRLGCPRSANIEYRPDEGNYRIRRRTGWREWTLAKSFQDAPVLSESGNHDMEAPATEIQQLPESLFGHRTKGHRTKVYKITNDDWFYLGTGRCVTSRNEVKIHVLSEDHPDKDLLDITLTDQSFMRQQETLIVWTQPDGHDMALSFQEPEGCDYIWCFILEWRPWTVHIIEDTSTHQKKGDDLAATTMKVEPKHAIFELLSSQFSADKAPYPLKSGRVKACADCQKSKRRCIHDEYGNVDPVKSNDFSLAPHQSEASPRRPPTTPFSLQDRYKLPHIPSFSELAQRRRRVSPEITQPLLDSTLASQGDSPFRRGSPYRQTNNSFNSSMVGTAAYAINLQMQSEETKTMSPKDAVLEYPD
ncbi:Platinum sensitivity protein [Neocucurbitaria cava]|uniref:Platinum sensitivity protein n=1 Tax=Neocucurbitaria cava TaxID=798079 RepID=A0A9W8Y8S0_9PLEO|nr:Platinum sensitivity protein [Neocucurbitaria cava]